MHLLQKSKERNASKEKRRIKDNQIYKAFRRKFNLNAGEYVRLLMKFSKTNITHLKK